MGPRPLLPRKRTIWGMLTEALKYIVPTIKPIAPTIKPIAPEIKPIAPQIEPIARSKDEPQASSDPPHGVPSKPKRIKKQKKPKQKGPREDVQGEDSTRESGCAQPAILATPPLVRPFESNSDTIPVASPAVFNATVPRSMRPIRELLGGAISMSDRTSPDKNPTGSVLKAAPGRLHELASAFKNTPITSARSRNPPSRKTLSLVKPVGNIRVSEHDSFAARVDGYKIEFESVHRDFLLPHEMAIREALRRQASLSLRTNLAPSTQPPQEQSGLTDSATEPTGRMQKLTSDTRPAILRASTKSSLASKSSRQTPNHKIKPASKETSRSLEQMSKSIPWLVPDDVTELSLPHEKAARRLLQRHQKIAGDDAPVSINAAAGPIKARSIGQILTGKSSLVDVLRERGLEDPGKRQNISARGNETRGPRFTRDVTWDSLIEQSPRPSSVSTEALTSHLVDVPPTEPPIHTQADSVHSASPMSNAHRDGITKTPEHGRRVISRRSVTPREPLMKMATETPKSPVTEPLWDSVVELETDFLLSYEVAAREALRHNKETAATTLEPTRSCNGPQSTASSAVSTIDHSYLSRDLPRALNRFSGYGSTVNSGNTSRALPAGQDRRGGINGAAAEEVENAPRQGSWDTISGDGNARVSNGEWDLFSGPLLPQLSRRSNVGQPSGSDQQSRRLVKRRPTSSRGMERAGSPSSFPNISERERDNGFSWDGWADDVDILYQNTSQSTLKAYAVPNSDAGWLNNPPDWRQASTENNTKPPHNAIGGGEQSHSRLSESKRVAASTTLSDTSASPPSSALDVHASWEVPMGESLDEWDSAKRARDRGRRERRELRYDDGSDTIAAESIRASKNRDRDRVRDRDHVERARGRGGRRETEHDHNEDWEEEWEERQQRKRERRLRKEQEEFEHAVPKPPQITIPEFIAVEDLARALEIPPVDLARALVDFGFESLTTKSVLTGETAALIAQEYGFEATVEQGQDRDLKPRPQPSDLAALPERPPVVTVMGHVDHGKTTMLDYLRKASVAAQEYGGITQHIGAFIVPMSSGKTITFLDTPGHAAFLAMRQRGANATDIVVLVVAADDSVKPQTIEAINHAKNAKVPIIVAINKIDKPGIRLDVVKADLARELELEDYGGDVQVVYTSGKTGAGMAELEESILTLSEVLDFRAEKDGMAEGWVIESSIKQVGKSAVVLVKRGTLRAGDIIVAGTSWARIRLLRNEAGQEIQEAPPGTPAEVVGWNDTLPDAGDELIQAPDEGKARAAILYRLEMQEREQNIDEAARQEQRRQEEDASRKATSDSQRVSDASSSVPESHQQASTPESGTKLLNFIVKSDVAGSAEAVSGAILQLGNHEVQPRILRSGAGAITEWDIEHASISGSTIVSFNIATTPPIRNLAQREGVTIIEHTIIYRLSDEIKAMLSSHLADKVTYRVTGEAEVLEIFPINVRGRLFYNIAGCRVRNGAVSAGSMARVLRKGDTAFEGKIESMRHGKKSVDQMFKGAECGIALSKYQGYETGDIIQTFEEVREARHL